MMLLAGVLVWAAIASAQVPSVVPTTGPSEPPELIELRKLDAQVQVLYDRLQRGVVRVQVPLPLWLSALDDRDNPLHKWRNQLDAPMRRQLESGRPSQTPRQNLVTIVPVKPEASTLPDERMQRFRIYLPTGQVLTVQGEQGNRRLVMIGPMRPRDLTEEPSDGRTWLNEVGLLLEDRTHLVVPLYIEQGAFDGRSVPAMVDHEAVAAHFVASDALTNLTLLRLERPVGEPLPLKSHRPRPGTLVLVLNPNDSRPQLTVWTDGGNLFGLVATVDGSAIGFARAGLFIDPPVCESVIRQLIQDGQVHRAHLGLIVHPVRADDPAVSQLRTMGLTGALRVERVMEDSAAGRGGVLPGDYLISLDATPINDTITLGAMLAERRGECPLVVLRNGRLVSLAIDLVQASTPEVGETRPVSTSAHHAP